MATSTISQPKADEPVVGNYFVAAYPPFSAWTPEQIPALEEALAAPAADAPVGLYVHVPFCQKKCDYCYYLSYVGQKPEVVDRYLETVVREFCRYCACPAMRRRRVAFVYFGGGTPSTLTSAQIRRLGNGLRSLLSWDQVEEVTFECAPRSVRRELLEALRELGVTRLSLGVQSFDNPLLKLNGRIHLAEDAVRAYSLIRGIGFDQVNLDLMVGLIGETPEQAHESVQRALALEPESITVYQTEIPHNTQLYRDLKAGVLPAAPVSWAIKHARLDAAFQQLEAAGYTVVSAYNAVKDPGRHRFLYQEHLWRGADMLGLGVASFGYFGGVHYQNEVTLEDYQGPVRHGALPVRRAFALTDTDQLVREFILQLKWGRVIWAPFREKFGVDPRQYFAVPLRRLQAEGFLSVDPTGVVLTRAGLLRVDRLLPHFYAPMFREIRYT
jgi:oxygen-independent coproporphyrinogen-3 oxidase